MDVVTAGTGVATIADTTGNATAIAVPAITTMAAGGTRIPGGSASRPTIISLAPVMPVVVPIGTSGVSGTGGIAIRITAAACDITAADGVLLSGDGQPKLEERFDRAVRRH